MMPWKKKSKILIINKYVRCNKRNINIKKKEFTDTNYKRLQEALVYIKKNLVDTDGSMYWTVDSLIEINNITGSNNINFRKVNVKPYGFNKMYMDKELIEGKLYQIIDQFNERKITSTEFYSILLNKIHPFYDGNGRTCKILFANDDIIKQNTYTNLNYI